MEVWVFIVLRRHIRCMNFQAASAPNCCLVLFLLLLLANCWLRTIHGLCLASILTLVLFVRRLHDLGSCFDYVRLAVWKVGRLVAPVGIIVVYVIPD